MSENISRRVQKEIIGFYSNMSASINNISTNFKKYKNIHFFQFYKHLKQQEHQINTLRHEYGKKTDIQDI